MKALSSALRDITLLDQAGTKRTPLHSLDPRVKIVTVLFFIVTVASFPARAAADLVPFFLFPLVMILWGEIPIRVFVFPVLLALGFGLLLGAANPFVDTEPVRISAGLVVRGGWLSLASILLRALLCVGAAVSLAAVTGIPRLCRGLARLGVPALLVSQILFMYRYLFLLGEEAVSVSRARALRSCGRPLGLRTYGSLVGHLLLRTFARAERIFDAMRCRGFRGEVPVGRTLRIGRPDVLFLCAWCGLFLFLRLYPVTALVRLLPRELVP